ncbi:sigma-70 family RNA polymerase sigma factor [Roseibium sp. HPY-6]|uniref:RNA polymerase sigma factor n=1 Tax=Roseibium sp. HPY-6 TaxID=3229852 RepID=UPI00338D5705
MGQLHAVNNGKAHQLRTDDDQLLRAVTRGDQAAFETIHRRHASRLLNFARRVTGDHEAAEEVTNDTFLVVWRKSDRFQGRSKASTWMFGIAYRLAIKQRQKRNGRTQELDLDSCEIPAGDDTADTIVQRRDLRNALQKLKPDLRTIVELTFFEGYLYSETADILGCPVGTVKSRMATAKNELRHHLSETATSASLAVAA